MGRWIYWMFNRWLIILHNLRFVKFYYWFEKHFWRWFCILLPVTMILSCCFYFQVHIDSKHTYWRLLFDLTPPLHFQTTIETLVQSCFFFSLFWETSVGTSNIFWCTAYDAHFVQRKKGRHSKTFYRFYLTGLTLRQTMQMQLYSMTNLIR